MVKLKNRRKHLASPWQSLWAPEYFIKVSGYSQYEDWHRALRLRWMPEQRVSHLESVSKTREKQPPAQILLCTGRRCLALLSSSLWHWEQLQQTSCQLWRNPELKAKNKHSTHLAAKLPACDAQSDSAPRDRVQQHTSGSFRGTTCRLHRWLTGFLIQSKREPR